MSDDTKWSAMKLEELRIVAKKYKAFHSLGNISKASKGALIDTLKKFMSWEGESLKQKTNATPITVEKVAPKAKKAPAPKAPPQAPPAPAVATGDKSYKKKVVARKVVQARGASADASAIKFTANSMKQKKMLQEDAEMRAENRRLSRELDIMDARRKTVKKKGKAQARQAVGDAMAIAPPKMEEMKPEAPPRPAVATGDKSYKKKVVAKKVVQARGASADAKAIAPPKMEAEKKELSPAELKKLLKQSLTASYAKEKEAGGGLITDLANSLKEKKTAEEAKAPKTKLDVVIEKAQKFDLKEFADKLDAFTYEDFPQAQKYATQKQLYIQGLLDEIKKIKDSPKRKLAVETVVPVAKQTQAIVAKYNKKILDFQKAEGAKKASSSASASSASASSALSSAEKKELKDAKEHLEGMNIARSMGMMMDEDYRGEIQSRIKALEKKEKGQSSQEEQPKGVLPSPYDNDITTTKRSDYWEYEVVKQSFDRSMKITNNGKEDPRYIDSDTDGRMKVMPNAEYLKLWGGLISVSVLGGIKTDRDVRAKNLGRSDLEVKLKEMGDDLNGLSVAESKKWWNKEKKKVNAPYFLAYFMNRMIGSIAGVKDEYKWGEYEDYKKNYEYLYDKQVWDKLYDVFVPYRSKAKK